MPKRPHPQNQLKGVQNALKALVLRFRIDTRSVFSVGVFRVECAVPPFLNDPPSHMM